MASPAVTRTVRPLEGLHLAAWGPPGLSRPAIEHLALLGAETRTDRGADLRADPGTDPEDTRAGMGGGAGAEGKAAGSGDGRAAHLLLSGTGFDPQEASVRWSAHPAGGMADEATVQAATGIMAVHGRRDGTPAAWPSTTPPPPRVYSPCRGCSPGCWPRPGAAGPAR